VANEVSLVFCFDERFGRYASVAIASALTNADAAYKVYCLYSGAPEGFPKEILGLAQRFRCEIVKVDVPPMLFAGWKTSEAYTQAVYHRLLIPQVVAEPRAIYLDCDLVVTCGLRALYDFDLEGAWIAGCPDLNSAAHNMLGLASDEPYLNSGVLLFDAVQLRAHRPLEVIHGIYQQNEAKILWPDQCLINKMAEGRKRVLDTRWNVQMHSIPPAELAGELDRREGEAVIHFTGPPKPWMEWSPSAARRLWSRYARIAGFSPDELLIRASDIPQRCWVAAQLQNEGDWKGAAEVWRELSMALIEHIRATQLAA
jgi:lipopolysaccharide biosynthesis glycosyltransferase